MMNYLEVSIPELVRTAIFNLVQSIEWYISRINNFNLELLVKIADQTDQDDLLISFVSDIDQELDSKLTIFRI